MQACLDSTSSELVVAHSSLYSVRERVEQSCARLADSQPWLEWLLSPSFCRFVRGVARLLSNNVPAHPVRLKGVVTLVSESLELDLRSIGELSSAAEREGRVSTPARRLQGRLL